MIRRASHILPILFILGLTWTPGETQTCKTSGADFLKIRTGARQLSMGSAFTGLADDANTLFWNPAGLFSLTDWSINLMHNNWLADLQLESFSSILPNWWDHLRLGFFGLQLWSPSWDNTGGQQPPERYRDVMVGVGLAAHIGPCLKLGATGKLIYRSLGNYTSSPALDLGLLYQPNRSLSLGAVIQNLGPAISLHETKEKLPLNLSLGGAYRGRISNWFCPTLIADISYGTIDRRVRKSLGTELWIKNLLALRLGANLDHSTTSLTFGVGLRWKFLNMDYAFLPFQQQMTSFTHPFSSYQAALNVRSLLPAPFHIIYPGLKQKALLREADHLGTRRINEYEELEKAFTDHYRSWPIEKIWEYLRRFTLVVDVGDTIRFLWERSDDADRKGSLYYQLSLYNLDTLGKENLFQNARDFLKGRGSQPQLIFSQRIPESSLNPKGNLLRYDLQILRHDRFPKGQYLWLAEAIDEQGYKRTCRDGLRLEVRAKEI